MTLLTVVLLGLATHAVFCFYEPRRPLRHVAGTLILLPLCVVLYGGDFSLRTVLSAYVAYIGTLCTSILLYRLSPFHPLAEYPGPLIFKVSKLSGVWLSYKGRQHLVLKALHDKYGPVVRIGPNDISMVDVDAVPAVFGPGGLPKGRYYDGRRDPSAPGNLLSMEPGEMHTRRRRLWSRGLSTEALRDYEDIIATRAQELADRLEQHANEAVDMVAWVDFFNFDFMGGMAFGEGYNMLRDGADKSAYWDVIKHGALSASMISHIPWAMPLLQQTPLVSRNLLGMRKLGVDSATARVKRGSTSKDLWYYLSDEQGLEPQKPQVNEVVADGTLAIIAGADTTASGVASLLYFLMRNKSCMSRVQEEIEHVYPDADDPLDSSKHGDLKYLNACINEALRLHPPVPTNGPRQVMKGSGSRRIAGYVIPEDTQIYIPPYVLQRDARYFPSSPDAFNPTRWLSETDVPNPNAFIPFSYGPANCVGRHLARREMLMVMSLLLKKFEMRFAEGFDEDAWPGTLHDYFVSARGPLMVRLRMR